MTGSDVDLLKVYFGDPYPINDKIIIHQPSIRDIIDYGEKEFFAVLFMFIGNTTYRKLFLWDKGIDWNKMSDYELFCNMVCALPLEKTRLFFGDINFEGFQIYEKTDYVEPEEPWAGSDKKPTATEKRNFLFSKFNDRYVLYNEEQDIKIDNETYMSIASVMREMVQIHPKTEYTVGKASKELLIEEERNLVKRAEKEADDHPVSTLQPLISACVNHPGFKYKTSELGDIHINEFMDSVKRLQIYESTHALFSGMYSGFVDTSKIPREQFDFMRSF